jgi:hypothetical protein
MRLLPDAVWSDSRNWLRTVFESARGDFRNNDHNPHFIGPKVLHLSRCSLSNRFRSSLNFNLQFLLIVRCQPLRLGVEPKQRRISILRSGQSSLQRGWVRLCDVNLPSVSGIRSQDQGCTNSRRSVRKEVSSMQILFSCLEISLCGVWINRSL